MRCSSSQLVAPFLLALLSSGCRLPGRDGSAPQALTDCRRLSQQGVTALERGNQPKAENLLAQAVVACPVDAEARRNYANALWRRGARNEAIAQLQEAVQLADEDASLWTRLAEMRLANGQLDQAAQDIERALALDPASPSVWAVRAGVLRANGKHREALADYLRALNFDPGNRNLLLSIAELHRELNQPERTLQTLQTLADTYAPGEEPGQVLYLTGLAQADLGQYDEAADSFAAAVARGNPTPDMFYHLGEAELIAGRPRQAADAARQALALQPQHNPSRDLLQRIELAQRPQGALR